MPNRPRPLAVAAAIMVLAAGARTAGADPNPTLTVRVRDEAHLPARTVDDALMIAGGVYRRAGVSLQWIARSEGDSTRRDLLIVIVPAAADAAFRVPEDSMGIARRLDGTLGDVAYVFYDRVLDFGERGHVDAWIVLGCAIAHELGHLLLPVNSHAPDGIMRANWDPKLISRAGGFLSFSPDQARLLRLRVANRQP